jgi:uncharacterized membrane protein HdeD (DUF308 family)
VPATPARDWEVVAGLIAGLVAGVVFFFARCITVDDLRDAMLFVIVVIPQILCVAGCATAGTMKALRTQGRSGGWRFAGYMSGLLSLIPLAPFAVLVAWNGPFKLESWIWIGRQSLLSATTAAAAGMCGAALGEAAARVARRWL